MAAVTDALATGLAVLPVVPSAILAGALPTAEQMLTAELLPVV